MGGIEMGLDEVGREAKYGGEEGMVVDHRSKCFL